MRPDPDEGAGEDYSGDPLVELTLKQINPVLDAIRSERLRQDEIYGFNRQYPDGQRSLGFALSPRRSTWGDILLAEVDEALVAPTPGALHDELIQVAAVACAWAEDLRRRNMAGEANLQPLRRPWYSRLIKIWRALWI